MFIYTFLEALVGLALLFFLVIRTKKSEGLVYGKLDRAGRITNVLLGVGYALVSPGYLLLGAISEPACEGFLAVVGWIVAITIGSVALFCCLGLGLSVALRRSGKSKASFAVQFAGALSFALALLLYYFFAGDLLISIN